MGSQSTYIASGFWRCVKKKAPAFFSHLIRAHLIKREYNIIFISLDVRSCHLTRMRLKRIDYEDETQWNIVNGTDMLSCRCCCAYTTPYEAPLCPERSHLYPFQFALYRLVILQYTLFVWSYHVLALITICRLILLSCQCVAMVLYSASPPHPLSSSYSIQALCLSFIHVLSHVLLIIHADIIFELRQNSLDHAN